MNWLTLVCHRGFLDHSPVFWMLRRDLGAVTWSRLGLKVGVPLPWHEAWGWGRHIGDRGQCRCKPKSCRRPPDLRTGLKPCCHCPDAFSSLVGYNAMPFDVFRTAVRKKNYAYIKSLIGPFFHWTLIAFLTLLRSASTNSGLDNRHSNKCVLTCNFCAWFFVIHTLVGLGWDQYYYVNRTANTSSMEPGTALAMHCHTRKKKRWKEGWCSLSFASVRAGTKTRWAPAQLPLWKSLSAFPDY